MTVASAGHDLLDRHVHHFVAIARPETQQRYAQMIMQSGADRRLIILAIWCHQPRKEGDLGNAAFWYSRAGKPVCREPLDAEWGSLAEALFG
jgi:hypothetical protein